jgi:hypothetical protein
MKFYFWCYLCGYEGFVEETICPKCGNVRDPK